MHVGPPQCPKEHQSRMIYPIFDHFQHANMEAGCLGDHIICSDVRWFDIDTHGRGVGRLEG